LELYGSIPGQDCVHFGGTLTEVARIDAETNLEHESDNGPLATVVVASVSGVGRRCRGGSGDTATTNRLTIRSYLSTAVKHGINAITALRDAITGNPWTPPAARIIQP